MTMRTYGRITNPDGSKTWVKVETDANGFNDAVWLTTLCQCFLLNLNESPFYASFGLPDEQAIIQQVAPDFYANRMAQYFSQFFASLILARDPDAIEPVYTINVLTQLGARAVISVPV
jgi:hypothetical protein